MPPVEITFHSRPPATQHTKLQKGAAAAKGHSRTIYFTINHGKASPTTHSALEVPNSTAGNTSKQPPMRPTMSKRAKPKVLPPPTHSASLTPLLQPIVTRCLAKSTNGTASGTSTPANSPPSLKKGGHKTSSATSTSGSVSVAHPYSRLTDTKNTRSLVPSPREVARAQQAELDKIRIREESAAAARAAAAAKRKKGKSRGSSKAVTSARATTSASPTKDDVPVVTTEAASKESTPAPTSAVGFAPRSGLKRTRSNGFGIAVNTANNLTGSPVVSSPLRAVTGPENDNEEEQGGSARKRSKLAETTSTRVTRRANSHSPHTASDNLPPDEGRLLKTEPLAAAELLPSTRRGSNGATDTTTMRRAVSSNGPGPVSKKMKRTGSSGSATSEARERSRRETTLPGRLRDYDTGAVP